MKRPISFWLGVACLGPVVHVMTGHGAESWVWWAVLGVSCLVWFELCEEL